MYSGDVTILPQYQELKEGANYIQLLPFQVFLTERLVSKNGEAIILRFVDGKYVSVGKIDQTKIEDVIKNSGSNVK